MKENFVFAVAVCIILASFLFSSFTEDTEQGKTICARGQKKDASVKSKASAFSKMVEILAKLN